MTVQEHIDALIGALPLVEDRQRTRIVFEHYSWGDWASMTRHHVDIEARGDGVLVLQISSKTCTQCKCIGFHQHAVCTRCNKSGIEP